MLTGAQGQHFLDSSVPCQRARKVCQLAGVYLGDVPECVQSYCPKPCDEFAFSESACTGTFWNSYKSALGVKQVTVPQIQAMNGGD